MLKTVIKQDETTNPPVFYHDKILSDASSTVTVFLHKTNDTIEEVGKGVLNSPLLFQTNLDWSNHRSFLGAAMESFRNTVWGGIDAIRDIAQGLVQLSGYASGKKVSGKNPVLSQATLVGGDGLHLKYQGSNSNLAIPDVTFVFINTNDTNDYLDRCSKLLQILLPEQKSLNGTGFKSLWDSLKTNKPNKNDYPNGEADEKYKKDLQIWRDRQKKINSTEFKTSYGYIETPPGDLHDMNSGYTMKGIWGYFSLKIGFKELYYLVPTNVRIQMSQTGSCFGSDKFWRPHFIYVTVGFTRIGKIFSQDMYHKLLYTDKLNTDQL